MTIEIIPPDHWREELSFNAAQLLAFVNKATITEENGGWIFLVPDIMREWRPKKRRQQAIKELLSCGYVEEMRGRNRDGDIHRWLRVKSTP